jgi:hypothetical protein
MKRRLGAWIVLAALAGRSAPSEQPSASNANNGVPLSSRANEFFDVLTRVDSYAIADAVLPRIRRVM